MCHVSFKNLLRRAAIVAAGNLGDAFRYDMRHGAWSYLDGEGLAAKAVPTARSGLGLAAVDKKLFLFGGLSHSSGEPPWLSVWGVVCQSHCVSWEAVKRRPLPSRIIAARPVSTRARF